MNKIVLAIVLISFSINAKSQTIDTSIGWCVAAKINPFYVQKNYPAKDTITHLGFFNYVDDLKGNCVVNYTLIASTTSRNVIQDSYKLTDGEYNSWNSSPEGLLRIIANYLSVTFK